jgi:hypothetical protein
MRHHLQTANDNDNDDKHTIEGYDAGGRTIFSRQSIRPILRSEAGMFAELHCKQRAVEEVNRALTVCQTAK